MLSFPIWEQRQRTLNGQMHSTEKEWKSSSLFGSHITKLWKKRFRFHMYTRLQYEGAQSNGNLQN